MHLGPRLVRRDPAYRLSRVSSFGCAKLTAYRYFTEPRRGIQSLGDMTRLILRAIDLGASAVFMALCTKAFCVHFYKDIERELRGQIDRHHSAPSGPPAD
jgi:hypothetical protein